MKITIICTRSNKADYSASQTLIDKLVQRNVDVFEHVSERALHGDFGTYFGKRDATGFPFDSDVIVVFGGDGSIIHMASACAPYGCAVLGVNCGRLGYLADTDEVTDELADRLASGDYAVETRMMLEITAGNETRRALNDLAVRGKNASGIVEIEALCGGESLGVYRCDGMIVASPTGSTAYSLSAGGSVVDPALRCLCLTPVCAHSLTARPLILAPDKTVTLVNKNSRNGMLQAAADGSAIADLPFGASASVCVSKTEARFVRTEDHSFFDTLRKKLV